MTSELPLGPVLKDSREGKSPKGRNFQQYILTALIQRIDGRQ